MNGNIDHHNTIIRLIVLFVLGILCSSCSMLVTGKALVPSYHPEGWTKFNEADKIYPYVFACGESMIHVRKVDIGYLNFIGPPLVPLIPAVIKEDKQLMFDIYLSSKDKMLPDKPLAIEIRVKPGEQTYSPVEIVPTQEEVIKPQRDGIYVYNDIVPDEENSTNMTHLYKFGVDRSSLEEFKLIFLSDFAGCEVTSMTFLRIGQYKYVPLFVAVH